jgi:hypothetical protein
MSAPAPSHRIETARVRRAPRYGAFLVVGAALGILVAMILTFAFDGSQEPSAVTRAAYSQGQVFGFIALFAIPLGIALAGVVALMIDRSMRRRAHDVRIDHERIDTAED